MRTNRAWRVPAHPAAAVALVVSGSLAAAAAIADPVFGDLPVPHANWALFAGATRTDNATLSEGGPSDTIANAGVALDFFREAGNLRADVNGSANYEDYLNGTYPSLVRGRLVANGSYRMFDGHLLLSAVDTFGQVNADPFAPSIPTNQVNANVVSVGPDATLPLGSSTDLTAGARYSQTDYGSNATVDVSSRTDSVNAGILHRLSNATAVSLNVASSQVDYRTAGHPTYDEHEVFARLQFRRARTDLTLDAGAAELREQGATVRDPLLRLTVLRKMTRSSSMYLEVGSEFQNAGLAFQSALTGKELNGGQLNYVGQGGLYGGAQGNQPADVILTQNALRADYARASIDFTRPRTSFDLTAGERRERYQFGGGEFDRNIFLATARATRSFRPSLDGHVLLRYMRRTPEGAEPADRTKQAEAALEWRAGSMLTVTLAYQRDDRSADLGGFAYTENRVFLGFALRGGSQPQAVGAPAPGGGEGAAVR